MCVHDGNDGTCGTQTRPAGARRARDDGWRQVLVVPYKGPYALVPQLAGLTDGHVYTRAHAPRILAGSVLAHTAVSSVSLTLRRSYRRRCYAFNGRQRPGSCAPAAARAASFKVSSDGELLLPAARGAGARPLRARHRGDRRRRQPHDAGARNIEDRVLCPLGAPAATCAGRTPRRARLERVGSGCAGTAAGRARRVALAGCGLGAGPAPSAITLTVTRDFGAQPVRSWSAPRVRGQETVMSLLMRNATVTTRYGGGFVQSIDGSPAAQRRAAASTGSTTSTASRRPRARRRRTCIPGDHIWWDLHDWSQTDNVPAVVGSFPEPFLNGIDGKRLPVRVECAAVCSARLPDGQLAPARARRARCAGGDRTGR